MKRMRKDGWELWVIEPSGYYGEKGFGWGDFWGYHKKSNTMGWIELKTKNDYMHDIQKKRRDDCKKCGVNYWVIRLDGNGYTMTNE